MRDLGWEEGSKIHNELAFPGQHICFFCLFYLFILYWSIVN